MIRTVVVAIDGSPSASRAFDLACEVAGAFEAKLIVLTVAPYRTYFPPGMGQPNVTDFEIATYKRLGQRAAEDARARGIAVAESLNLEGFTADAIIDYAEAHPPDLLVLGARGLSGARRMFLGGVSTSVVNHVRCPVLIVAEPPHAAKDPPGAERDPGDAATS